MAAKLLLPMRELLMIRGKILVDKATDKEKDEYFAFVDLIEKLLDRHSSEGCFMEGDVIGWRRMYGLEE